MGAIGHVIHGMYILPVSPGRSRLFYWHKAGSLGGASLDRLKALKAPFGAGKAQLQHLVAAAEKFFVAKERSKRHMYLHPIFEAVGGLLHGQVCSMQGDGSSIETAEGCCCRVLCVCIQIHRLCSHFSMASRCILYRG